MSFVIFAASVAVTIVDGRRRRCVVAMTPPRETSDAAARLNDLGIGGAETGARRKREGGALSAQLSFDCRSKQLLTRPYQGVNDLFAGQHAAPARDSVSSCEKALNAASCCCLTRAPVGSLSARSALSLNMAS